MNKNKEILLTVYYRGRLASSTARKINKRYVGNKLIITQADPEPTKEQECVRKLTIRPETIRFFTSYKDITGKQDGDSSIPSSYRDNINRRKIWARLDDVSKINIHLSELAEGNRWSAEQ